MGYSAYLKPRRETISEDGIEGIIDLANLNAEGAEKIEANPDAFFNITYPTSDVLKVLEQIDTRFSSKKSSSGLFLFEGLKGSGKSHLLLLIYNLFKYPIQTQSWLKQRNIRCHIPSDDFIVVINKFTDNPYDSIWDMIFSTLGHEVKRGKTQPKLPELEKALGERRLILIFDELEQGIKVISDPALQAQNIAFLQMLSEFGNRSKQVTIFASIYSDREEPGSTLKRIPRCSVQFDNSKDRCHVVLHRLFENYLNFNRPGIFPVIESYVELWQKHIPLDPEELKCRFQATYPFTPSLMDIILKKIPTRGGFQNVRGALAFLGNLVKLTHLGNDIITPGDASLTDRANAIMLRDLDVGGDLIERARENMEELKTKVPIADKIASSTLLYTLTSLDTHKGVARDALLQDTLSPTIDINAFNQGLMSFQKYASYFHTEGDRFYFDLEEQPEAKVEYKSLQYENPAAQALIIELFKTEVFRENLSTVVFTSPDDTKQSLNQFDKTRPRYVLAGRRLTQEERHIIYFGLDFRNLIILLEPKDDSFQLLSDRDILKWAKRVLAAKALAGSAREPKKSDYNRIATTDKSHLTDRIKKAGLVFVNWIDYGENVSNDRIELEPIQGDGSKDKVLASLNEDYFPMLRFKEHLESRLENIKDKLVKDVDGEYKATLGFPVPANFRAVSNAIRELCKENLIGIQHSRGNYCRKNPDLSETEFFTAKIVSPFEEQTPPPSPVCEICGQKPCVCIIGDPPRPPITYCAKCGQKVCVCPKKEIVLLKVPFQRNIGNLREEVASKLQPYEDAEITKAGYKIFYEQDNLGDISTLPSSLRGNLSGQGSITAEISISKAGSYTKAQIEQQIESLPLLSGAEYSAELTLEINRKG